MLSDEEVYDVPIFILKEEIPTAGHLMLGTAYIIACEITLS